MNISKEGVNLICEFEAFRDEAYLDIAGVWTVGYGTTIYPNGVKVKQNDFCNELEAQGWVLFHLNNIIEAVNSLNLNQTQFDACCSLAYNIGLGNFLNSTLYRYAKEDPNDSRIYLYDPHNPALTSEFTRWIYIKGKQNKGLLNRRIKEADLYSPLT